MFSRLFRRGRRDDSTAPFLYGAIVASARTPALYSEIGVPDTVNGRFEMVVLHMALVMRRLDPGGETARATGQTVFDLFCRDMDNSLRELGVSDLKVPKRMRQVGEAYYGRVGAYEPGLTTGNADMLAGAIARTVFAGEDSSRSAKALAAYTIAAADLLAAQDESEIVAARPDFPDVGSLVEVGGTT